MKWVSLLFAIVSMSALGWLVWQLATRQERRALQREGRDGCDKRGAIDRHEAPDPPDPPAAGA